MWGLCGWSPGQAQMRRLGRGASVSFIWGTSCLFSLCAGPCVGRAHTHTHIDRPYTRAHMVTHTACTCTHTPHTRTHTHAHTPHTCTRTHAHTCNTHPAHMHLPHIHTHSHIYTIHHTHHIPHIHTHTHAHHCSSQLFSVCAGPCVGHTHTCTYTHRHTHHCSSHCVVLYSTRQAGGALEGSAQ